MQVTVLGTASVQRRGVVADLGGPKVRSLLAALALYPGRAVSPDRIIDLLWQQNPPPAVTASLQTYVAKLRRAFEPERVARTPSTVLLTSPAGYTLKLPAGALDATRFRQSVEHTHRQLPRPTDGLPAIPAGMTGAALTSIREQLTATLDVWSDTPFLDLPDDDDVLAERAGLSTLRLVTLEDLALVRIAMGEESSVAADLEQVVANHPLRESSWALRILALARSGQQHDALAAARKVRRLLADELGVDPGPMLQDLERAVLKQSAELWWRPVEGPAFVRDAAVASIPSTPPNDETGRSVPVVKAEPPTEWPMVGRHAQLEQLRTALNRAENGSGGAAMLIGEPGIGKTRLLRELAGIAVNRGFIVVSGSCSQDDGAPSLWPWSRILAALEDAQPGAENERVGLSAMPGAGVDRIAVGADNGTRWELWESVLNRLQSAAAIAPLLVLVDDLHWADPSTLILLRHVVERLADPGLEPRIIIVMARRRFPESKGPLASLGETLARTDAQRIELGGLEPAEVGQLVRAATGEPIPDEQVGQLWDRSGGNAFFVTELIRLSLQTTGQVTTEIPSAVSDVVLSRLSALPHPTRRIVDVAAVIGRDFDAVLLASVTANDVEGVLDLLDPALATDLVIERAAGQFRFSHALVRDAVRDSLSATRRALRHAEIADALDRGQTLDVQRARSEAARHWLAAGPQHAATAWRAATAAAADAMSLRAWEQAANLLSEAITVTGLDPAATDRDRYDLRMQLADAYRWSGDRAGMDAALQAAIVDAQRMDEVELLAGAAIGSMEGSAWFPRAYAEVDTDRVSALRSSLRRLPSNDSELRCRVMLALANELYYADAPQEIAALTEQGLASARRIDNARLLVWATSAAYQANWKPSNAELRHGWMIEALNAGIGIGDPRTEAVTRYLLAGAAQEIGRIDEMREQIQLSRTLAQRHRLPTVEVALGWLEAPWLALEGRYPEAYALIEQTAEMMKRTSMNQQSEALAGTVATIQVIQGQLDEAAVDQFSMVASSSEIPMSANVLVVLLRAGRRAEVQEIYEARGLTLGPETWFSLTGDSLAAEVAIEMGDRDLAMAVYRRIAPYAGRPATAAASAAIWPVDWFLAVAAAATGENAVATTHADEAERLCHQWRIEPAIGWIRDQRARFGF